LALLLLFQILNFKSQIAPAWLSQISFPYSHPARLGLAVQPKLQAPLPELRVLQEPPE